MFCNQNKKEDNLHYRSEGCLYQDSRHLWHLASIFLSCKTEQIGNGNHGDIGEDENKNGMIGSRITKDYGDRDKGPQKVDIFGDFAATAPGDIEEVPEVEPTAAGFAVRMDLRRDYVTKKGC